MGADSRPVTARRTPARRTQGSRRRPRRARPRPWSGAPSSRARSPARRGRTQRTSASGASPGYFIAASGSVSSRTSTATTALRAIQTLPSTLIQSRRYSSCRSKKLLTCCTAASSDSTSRLYSSPVESLNWTLGTVTALRIIDSPSAQSVPNIRESGHGAWPYPQCAARRFSLLSATFRHSAPYPPRARDFTRNEGVPGSSPGVGFRLFCRDFFAVATPDRGRSGTKRVHLLTGSRLVKVSSLRGGSGRFAGTSTLAIVGLLYRMCPRVDASARASRGQPPGCDLGPSPQFAISQL